MPFQRTPYCYATLPYNPYSTQIFLFFHLYLHVIRRKTVCIISSMYYWTQLLCLRAFHCFHSGRLSLQSGSCGISDSSPERLPSAEALLNPEMYDKSPSSRPPPGAVETINICGEGARQATKRRVVIRSRPLAGMMMHFLFLPRRDRHRFFAAASFLQSGTCFNEPSPCPAGTANYECPSTGQD